jgi:hypothetical protein
MPLSFAQKIRVPENVLMQELQGESVLLNLNGGRYFGLDNVGTRMWQVFTTSASIEQALEVLQSEYEVSPDVLRKDLGDLVDKLVEHGLVELCD